MTNFFAWAGGVTAEAKYAKEKGQETMLKLFGFFICLAFILAFFCMFLPFSINAGNAIGAISGLIWATVVIVMDRLLFASGKLYSILLRVLILISTSFLTSFMLGLGLQDAKIIENIQIHTQTKRGGCIIENVSNKERILAKTDSITALEVKLAREGKLSEKMLEVLEKEKERYNKLLQVELEKVDYITPVIQEDNSLGNKLSTYWNMPKEEKFGGAYWFVFIIELLPLITRLVYYFIYGSK